MSTPGLVQIVGGAPARVEVGAVTGPGATPVALVEVAGPAVAVLDIVDTDGPGLLLVPVGGSVGPAGPAGPPGTGSGGGGAFTYRGPYDSAEVYTVGDVVTHLGTLWVAHTTTGPGAFDPAAFDPYATGGAYTHLQAVPGTVWTITHALGFDPAGIVVTSDDGYTLDGFGVQILTPGSVLRLSFDIAVAGTAHLS